VYNITAHRSSKAVVSPLVSRALSRSSMAASLHVSSEMTGSNIRHMHKSRTAIVNLILKAWANRVRDLCAVCECIYQNVANGVLLYCDLQ